jgi:hypothetical protein
MKLPLHVSVHIYDHLQGAREQSFYDQIPPGQEPQTHIQTDGNDIRPHTAQTHNERTSTEFNLVNAYSTAHGPPEDGRKCGPKHVGATSFQCFLKCF